MPVETVTFYICSRCRFKEKGNLLKYGDYSAPAGWAKASFVGKASHDLCRKCTEELDNWFKPIPLDRGL